MVHNDKRVRLVEHNAFDVSTNHDVSMEF